MLQPATAPTALSAPPGPAMVRQLRQILLWPLRVMAPASDGVREDGARPPPWQHLRDLGEASPWREVVDEYTGGIDAFHERHYNEFVTFLPYVQHFLYGEGRSGRGARTPGGGSPMRVFRRNDIQRVRTVPRPGDTPLVLDIVHADLYFFYDVDVVILNLEVRADDLPLASAQELLYRFGRAYPAGWDADGLALHCLHEVEWLDGAGRVLAPSSHSTSCRQCSARPSASQPAG